MNPIVRKQRDGYVRSQAFITACIQLIGSDFSIDKSFDNYTNPDGSQKFSNEAIAALSSSLEDAKYYFGLFNSSLPVFVANQINKLNSDGKNSTSTQS